MEDVLLALLVTPFAKIAEAPLFFAEVAVGGVLTGVMYSLVALGFVLIFKASGIFNFAQGVMVLFAALTLVGLMERGVPTWLALILTAAVMTALAFAIERVVLQQPVAVQVEEVGERGELRGGRERQARLDHRAQHHPQPVRARGMDGAQQLADAARFHDLDETMGLSGKAIHRIRRRGLTVNLTHVHH